MKWLQRHTARTPSVSVGFWTLQTALTEISAIYIYIYIYHVVMSGNPLYFLSDDFFRPVENLTLKSLALYKCYIVRISTFTLEPLRSLEMLDLSSNKLYNAMLDECNEKLGYSTLQVLYLSGNLLYALDAIYIFLENKLFSNLTDLVMQQSQVRKVEMKSVKIFGICKHLV